MLTNITNVATLSTQSIGDVHTTIKPTAVLFSTVHDRHDGLARYLNLKLLENSRVQGERIPITVLAFSCAHKDNTGSSGTPIELFVTNITTA